MLRRSIFLVAYTCSGLAGLVYEVSWTRLLTLFMGHTTAAASTVVAAFMGGLAGGSLIGGRIAPRLTPRQCLYAYIALESLVAALALLLPLELSWLRPLLVWAYRDGAPGALFPFARLLACLILLLVPAGALGATFPLAVRWLTGGTDRVRLGRLGGMLYALNTAGAAIGALSAGFVLIPAIGVSGATWVGVAASGLAIAAVVVVMILSPEPEPLETSRGTRPETVAPTAQAKSKKGGGKARVEDYAPPPLWLAPTILAMTGFSSLMFEIAWMRVLALALGPTTYAFATTVAALIAGLACGSGAGAWLAGRRPQRSAMYLALVLVAAAITASIGCTLAGGEVPRRVAEHVANAPDTFARMLSRAAVLAGVLVFPTAVGLGAAFPLTLSLVGSSTQSSATMARQVGGVYAVNTVAAVAGSLAAGFLTIPIVGLQQTLRLVTALLIMAGLVVVFWGRVSSRGRRLGLAAALVGLVVFTLSPPWDRELLASGVYKYSAYVAQGVDVESALKAGTLLYYGEGAASTVTVKRLTGTVTLAIDGKVDASNASDMLTQKLIAHLPLLLHENPRQVCIIGVGSGVTLEAALRHPVSNVDVLEISPQVVEASRLFAEENRNALDDRRTHLIVGDGRSHLALSKRQYDVIISEPSNPWIAGVASLFTREFFLAARDRLAPGGIVSQWAHTYNISSDDLRSIVATFTSVFPNGTVWMVGEDDVLLIASADPLDARLPNIAKNWVRPGVSEDLGLVSAEEPFAIWSLYAGGPAELRGYGGGAALQTDDRTALEFSGPRAMDNRGAVENAAALRRLLDPHGRPDIIRQAMDGATSVQWQGRAAMMLKADVPSDAYDDYVRAIEIGGDNAKALDGLARTALLSGRGTEAVERLDKLGAAHPTVAAIWVAKSRVLAGNGIMDGALEAARRASEITPLQNIALEQLASLFSTQADSEQLDVVVKKMQQTMAGAAATYHFSAAAALLHEKFDEAVKSGQAAIAADPTYAAAYDLVGAAHLKLGQLELARNAFQTSLRFNAHDTTAYTNLGILELQSGNREGAGRYFAEALWLDPESKTAREGLAQAR